jgi:hypothetical protein
MTQAWPTILVWGGLVCGSSGCLLDFDPFFLLFLVSVVSCRLSGRHLTPSGSPDSANPLGQDMEGRGEDDGGSVPASPGGQIKMALV